MFTNDEMDATFHAMAHVTRRQILDYVRDKPGLPIGVLARNFDVSRIAIMNHLAVLESAGLIISENEGRTRRLFLNVMPIQEIHDRWTDVYSAYWSNRMSLIKSAAEAANRSIRKKGAEND